MTLQASNVRVAVTGGIYQAPSGTALAMSALSDLDVAYDELGYASGDGVKQSIGADTTSIKAWQGGSELRKIQTSHALTFDFTMLETSDQTLETYYGNVEDLGGGETLTRVTADQLDHYVWAIHIIDGDYRLRLLIPDGQVTDRGDVSYVNGDAISYPVTLSCFPDDDNVKAYIYKAQVTGS